jgi:mannose-6-phosphate isomerase
MAIDPVVLGPNMPDTFYRGAGRISQFRGTPFDQHPEDWIGSATERRTGGGAGLTRLADGTLLADAIASDPLAWLGAAHTARFGSSPALLVKLLDAGQRLPLHVHPGRAFAQSHLAVPFGKTEAWVILEAPADAAIHLGFARDVSGAQLADWVHRQDVGALLDATNRVPVAAGDALLCPAGTPHAIGEGVLLLELQEPTDFSILLEWEGFPLTVDDASLGLPLDLALECVERGRCDEARLAALRGVPNALGTLLPAEADDFFVAERIGAGPLPAEFSVVVVTAGGGDLHSSAGSTTPIGRGQTVLIPYAAGDCAISGAVTAIRCRSGNRPALASRSL